MFKQAPPSNKRRTRGAKNQISAAVLIRVNTVFLNSLTTSPAISERMRPISLWFESFAELALSVRPGLNVAFYMRRIELSS